MFMSKKSLPLFGLSAGLVFALACGSDDSQEPQAQSADPVNEKPDAEKPDAGKTPSPVKGDAAQGALVAEEQLCGSCHGADYAGVGYYPNITPHEETGIGAWSDQGIANASAEGLGVAGGTLCTLMPRAFLPPSDLADLVAYLRSLPAVDNEVSKECPGRGR